MRTAAGVVRGSLYDRIDAVLDEHTPVIMIVRFVRHCNQ